MQSRAADEITPTIERLVEKTLDIDRLSAPEAGRVHQGLETALSLRSHILAEHPAPRVRIVLQAVSTILIPAIMITLQLLLQKMFA
ncbi:hypothetical protein FRACA_1110014 [Frankia canadensis]|uniref:Uncharacterized protein n=2 Tax=Frankia canadensis TaxID=1836972 RepID=A0A2I2KJE9_9ACTN|nr:hypothetical protein FRACA_1110014 [Frankia canadensis]SOU53067.1 hypothetical protein FRACA_1110014 [Frankia canadensis]